MHCGLQKEHYRVKLHPLHGKALKDDLHAAIMLPAQELTLAADLMGMTSTLQSSASMVSAATA